ncbi:hypothetical protein PGTUg99_032429 [Puccinia graminis f. sp. tritici]|uniref:Uncharacterized protein n=1 Tax=Puccinia graminis f. sp. tritici TaxID=56615 RepID=A0A5B0SIS0_PUCGR|nr:hypothetical protein PGTUg99_032429 [Puccinia graminis f. sp. tritici]
MSQTSNLEFVRDPNLTSQDPPGPPGGRLLALCTGARRIAVFFGWIVVGPSERAQDPRISLGTSGLLSERTSRPPRPLLTRGSSRSLAECSERSPGTADPYKPPQTVGSSPDDPTSTGSPSEASGGPPPSLNAP